MITQERLHEALNYDPNTGIFTWKINRKRARIGDIAGTKHGGGYLVTRIDQRMYFCHRLAWLYVNGNLPDKHIDHINCVRSDNRIANLREATHSENMHNRKTPSKNNKSGFMGVSFDPVRKQWKTSIKVNRVTTYLGRYNSPEEAHKAYVAAKRKLHSFCTI